MTAAQLRAALAALLASHLGVFTRPNGATLPAIWVGEPPADWKPSGLECNIALDPAFDNTPLQNREHNLAETYRVRLISHDGSALASAVRAVARRFSGCAVTEIPANEQLGILSQALITIPK